MLSQADSSFAVVPSLRTYVGCSGVQAVLHELLDGCGQVGNDLAAGDLMNATSIDGWRQCVRSAL